MTTTARRRRALHLGGMIAAALVMVWVVAALVQVRSAHLEAERAHARLRAVRASLTPGTLSTAAVAGSVAAAETGFERVHDHLASGLLDPVRMLPVLGRQVRAADAEAVRSARATAIVVDGLRRYRTVIDRPHRVGSERVRRLRELGAISTEAARRLRAVEPGATAGLVAPVARPIARSAADRSELAATLAQAGRSARSLADVLEGPSRYLVVGANNAEMRAGTGMFLSAGSLTLVDGRLALGPVRPTADLVLLAGSAPATGDLAANWPWLDPGRDLRNAALSPDFPQVAALAARTWRATPGGGPVDGVIAVDVDGLRALLRAVGPVTVGGVRYDADTVRGELLRRQYHRFGADREARRERVGAVARAVFGRLESGDWSLGEVGDALVVAARGRHLLAWSADAAAQASFDRLGVSGRLHADSVAVSLLNRGAEKLDSYLDVEVHLDTESRADGRTELTVRCEVTNRAPLAGPRYLLGPNAPGLDPGEHRAIVLVDLPAGVSGVRWRGGRMILRGADGPAAVAAGEVLVPRGGRVTIVVRAVLPAGLTALRLEPSARVPATVWTVDGRRMGVERRRTVTLRATG